MSEPFIGEVRLFGFNYAPRSWAVCQGQSMPITQYTTLFALISTTYGGDGRTNFNLPDLRGRVPVGFGHGPGLMYTYSQGQIGGYEQTTLSIANMPTHSHDATSQLSSQQPASNATADQPTPNGNVPAASAYGRDPVNSYATTSDNSTLQAGTVSGTITIGSTGNGQSFNNLQPFLVMNYCIALDGLWPSRN